MESLLFGEVELMETYEVDALELGEQGRARVSLLFGEVELMETSIR